MMNDDLRKTLDGDAAARAQQLARQLRTQPEEVVCQRVQLFTAARTLGRERPGLARGTLRLLREPSMPDAFDVAEKLARARPGLALGIVHLPGSSSPDAADGLLDVMAGLHVGAEEGESSGPNGSNTGLDAGEGRTDG